jgi:hypothetical protein
VAGLHSKELKKGLDRFHDAPALPQCRRERKQHPRITVQETGCGVVWLCPLRFAGGKGGGNRQSLESLKEAIFESVQLQ